MPTIKIHCRPGAKHNRLYGWAGDCLKIQVKSLAKENQANKALVKFLADFCGISTTDIRIIHGQTSHHKLISLPSSALSKLQTGL